MSSTTYEPPAISPAPTPAPTPASHARVAYGVSGVGVAAIIYAAITALSHSTSVSLQLVASAAGTVMVVAGPFAKAVLNSAHVRAEELRVETWIQTRATVIAAEVKQVEAKLPPGLVTLLKDAINDVVKPYFDKLLPDLVDAVPAAVRPEVEGALAEYLPDLQRLWRAQEGRSTAAASSNTSGELPEVPGPTDSRGVPFPADLLIPPDKAGESTAVRAYVSTVYDGAPGPVEPETPPAPPAPAAQPGHGQRYPSDTPPKDWPRGIETPHPGVSGVGWGPGVRTSLPGGLSGATGAQLQAQRSHPNP